MNYNKPTIQLVFCSIFLLLIFCNITIAQTNVNYNIDVRLNDKKNTLQGFVQMEYKNVSSDTLNEIFIHLWPNAYSNQKTPFAKQQIKLKQTSFHYVKEEDYGSLTGVNFIVNNKAVEWLIDSNNTELAKVILPEGLVPNQSITLGTPFNVKIPAPFSRLGQKKQQYQITQWYPKPAVYDKNGWNTMPYLDQGEFFSEFANFKVRITLPANYVVAASGELVTQSETKWLSERAAWSSDLGNADEWYSEVPKSADSTKSIEYEIKNAHDFAWFADKRYLVEQDKIKLQGRTDSILIQTFYLPEERSLWHKAIEYTAKGLHFYNNTVGTYPYPAFSTVSGALGAGSGMEYPGVTVIGETGNENALETVIVHEIGHNWFYGVLANNERAYPWLDESINSYYEVRYLREEHPDQKLINEFPKVMEFLGLDEFKHDYQNNLFYLFSARRNESQPIGESSEAFSSLNYGAMVYGKGALAFDYLSYYLGEAKFDKIMQGYFKEYGFKHHYPEDLQNYFEAESEVDLSWFFEELIPKDQHIDFSIKKVKKKEDHFEIKLKNKSDFSGPVPIQQYQDDSLLSEKWIPGFQKDTTILMDKENAKYIYIDRSRKIPEFNTQNNNFRVKGLANKLEKIRFQFLGSLDNPEKSELYFFPVYAWNNYDKSMLGLVFYNHTLLNKRLEFELLPMYSTATYNFSGTGNINYNWWPKSGKVREVKLGMSAKRFAYLLFPEVQRFHKANPYLNISFKRKTPLSPIAINLQLRSVNIWQDYLIPQTKNGHFYTNEADLNIANDNPLFPWNFNTKIRQGKYFGSVQASFNFDIPYRQGREAIKIQFFAGGFLWNNKSSSDISPPIPRMQLSGSTGSGSSALLPVQGDYLFDHSFLDRNGIDPVFGQQIVNKDGGFKSRTIIGDTDRFLSTLTIASTFPGKIPLKPYAGFAAFIDRSDEFNIAAELGISLVIVPEIFEINLPIVTTNNIKNNQESGSLGLDKYYEKITFTLNINAANPFKQVKKLSF